MSRVGIGQRPQNRRQKAVKFLWVGVWLAYLSAPVNDLLHGGHSDDSPELPFDSDPEAGGTEQGGGRTDREGERVAVIAE